MQNIDIKNLKIIKYPNEILRRRSVDIEKDAFSTPLLKELAEKMLDILKKGDGIGLAAPQVGLSWNLILVAVDAKGEKIVALVNPKITYFSARKSDDLEGCLSLPKIFGRVSRAKKIKVKAFDLEGNRLDFTAKDLLARVIAHECDHLAGVLFIDRATEITQGKEILDKLKKNEKV